MKKFVIFAVIFMVCFAVSAEDKPFSSVVIDARGINLERSMSPKILSENGLEIYGTILKDLDKVMEQGVVLYAFDLDTAIKYSKDRVGNNPLTVKAVKSAGLTDSYAVVSDDDAKKILAENKKSGFLEKFKVIILINPPEMN